MLHHPLSESIIFTVNTNRQCSLLRLIISWLILPIQTKWSGHPQLRKLAVIGLSTVPD